MRASRSCRCCVTSEAFIDTEFTLPSSRSSSTTASSSSAGIRTVSEALGLLGVGARASRCGCRPGRRPARRGRGDLGGRVAGSSTVIETQPVVMTLRSSSTGCCGASSSPPGIPAVRGRLHPGVAAGARRRRCAGGPRARGAAGEEQCGEGGGRRREWCASASHALTVSPRPTPMSGRPLGVGSRSGCASL